MRREYSKAVCAISTGRSHRAEGTPCQDAATEFDEDGVTGVCLADGAGSAAYSQFGSRAVTEAVSSYLAANFTDLFLAKDEEIATAVIRAAVSVLEREAERLGQPLKQLACTLAFACMKMKGKSLSFLCGNLGDGVVLMRSGKNLRVLLSAENSEYANQTWFVTSDDAKSHLRLIRGVASAQAIPGWVISTDGAAPLLHSKKSGKFAPAVMSVLEDLRTQKKPRAKDLLQSLLDDVLVPLTFDDCSLGVLQTVAKARHIPRMAE